MLVVSESLPGMDASHQLCRPINYFWNIPHMNWKVIQILPPLRLPHHACVPRKNLESCLARFQYFIFHISGSGVYREFKPSP
jgi:hypothetical protein